MKAERFAGLLNDGWCLGLDVPPSLENDGWELLVRAFSDRFVFRFQNIGTGEFFEFTPQEPPEWTEEDDRQQRNRERIAKAWMQSVMTE